jgi:hypothetical protein
MACSFLNTMRVRLCNMKRNWISHVLFWLLLVFFIICIYIGWFPMVGPNMFQRVGYFIGIFFLLLGLNGLWLPNTHLFHNYVFRFIAYSGIILIIFLVLYPIFIDIILQIRNLK